MSIPDEDFIGHVYGPPLPTTPTHDPRARVVHAAAPARPPARPLLSL